MAATSTTGDMDPSSGNLPDDILRSVIRWLPTREAVRTSLVSKSWRYLWASSVADIDLDRDDMSDMISSQIFARNVDTLLSLHCATMMIDTFRISFPTVVVCSYKLDGWVRAAIRKQAKKLILDFIMCQYWIDYSFPLHLLLENVGASSQLNHLQLRSCDLEIPDKLCGGLASLKILKLDRVTVSNLQSLISNCCLLESVTITVCRGINDIKLGSSLGRLKHLKVQGRFSVTICSLNLVSIEDLEVNTILLNNELQFPLPSITVAGSIIAPCPSLTRFGSLQKVSLCSMPLAEQDLINLFSVCPVLERLQLRFSFQLRSCLFPRIPLHHRLQYLEVEGNGPDDIEVEICCGPCLVDVRWHVSTPPIGGVRLMHVRLVNSCDGGQVFSSSSASPLTRLHLVNCTSRQILSKYAPFKNLQQLTLAPVRLGGRDIRSLLFHCSHLQRLRLADGGSRFQHFKIPFPCHPLRYLELKDNKFLDKVDLCSDNLAFFELHTTLPVNLRVKQAPKLTRVSVGSWSEDARDVTIRNVMELPSLIPGLETLMLLFVGRSTVGETTILARLPEFKHLKRLVIVVDYGCYLPQSYLWLVPLIHSAPELQIFELHLDHFARPCEKPKSDDSPDDMEFLKRAHNHLKEVKISGFRGCVCEINMAVYLLKYARSLELMTIETHWHQYEGDDKWKIYKNGRADPHIRTRLMKHVSSSTKLVV